MNKNYKLSFTSNSLHLEETTKIADIYINNREWEFVQKTVMTENILQKEKSSTAIREFREIKDRLSNLTNAQLELLTSENIEVQKYIIFLAICKTYDFIKEFVVEVVRYKFIQFQTSIYDADYDDFFESKAVVYDKLNIIADTTKAKIKQVLFKILSQVGIINSVKDKFISQPFLTPNLIEVIVKDNPELLKIFLLTDTDIKNNKVKYG